MSCYRRRSLISRLSMTLALSMVFGAVLANPCFAQNNLANNGGPVLQNTIRVFMIYWLPSGVVLDTAVADGVGNFQSLNQRFYGDISGSLYANILLQYPGKCGANNCVLQNGSGAFALAGSFVDSQSFPRIPLQDSDIQDEIGRVIGINHWTTDANTIFFVTTGVFKSSGAAVMECRGSLCTAPGGFCAYHARFNLNGSVVAYGYLSDATFNRAGCNERLVVAPNGQAASDRQIAMMSHELFETVTDPLGDAWFDNITGTPTLPNKFLGNEIGDNCNQLLQFHRLRFPSNRLRRIWRVLFNIAVNTASLICKSNLIRSVLPAGIKTFLAAPSFINTPAAPALMRISISIGMEAYLGCG